MLTLTRRSGERIVIGSQIEVVVLGVSRGRVRLGVRAPRELTVHRGEVVERIEEENLRAMASELERLAPADATLTFPEGLFGLPDHKEFLLCEIESAGNLKALVSKKDPMLQLLVVDAREVWPNYPLDEAQKAAGITDEDVGVATVVRLPADGTQATVNLMAPLVIGMTSRKGWQVILERPELGVAHGLTLHRTPEGITSATGQAAPHAPESPQS